MFVFWLSFQRLVILKIYFSGWKSIKRRKCMKYLKDFIIDLTEVDFHH